MLPTQVLANARTLCTNNKLVVNKQDIKLGFLKVAQINIMLGNYQVPHDRLIELLFKQGLNETDFRSCDNFVLQRASEKGYLHIVRFVMEQVGLNIRIQNNACLRFASQNGYCEIVRYLISRGLTLEDIRSCNNYALHNAMYNNHLETVQFLMSQGLTQEEMSSCATFLNMANFFF